MFNLKGLAALIAVIASALVFNVNVFAQNNDYGIESLYDSLPDGAREYVEENGISADGSGISDITVEGIFKNLWETAVSGMKQPSLMFAALLAVIILTAVLGGLGDTAKGASVEKAFSVVSSLTSTIIISSYLSGALSGINTAIASASGFMLTYIPVLAGIIAVGGHASTAAVFSSVMMISIQLLTQITANILFPLTSCLIGISAAGGLNGDLKLDKLSDGIKKAVVWGLGLIMTIFIGFLTLQTNITASADSVTLRAARFAVSTGVPFIGGAVSDALSTVKTSIELLKSGVGSFGIVIGCCLLCPVLINALCYRFFLFLAGVLSDIFGADDAGRMIKCGENVLSIVISMLICLLLFMTVSTALMLMICRQ